MKDWFDEDYETNCPIPVSIIVWCLQMMEMRRGNKEERPFLNLPISLYDNHSLKMFTEHKSHGW